jgi:hypothetical protein
VEQATEQATLQWSLLNSTAATLFNTGEKQIIFKRLDLSDQPGREPDNSQESVDSACGQRSPSWVVTWPLSILVRLLSVSTSSAMLFQDHLVLAWSLSFVITLLTMTK